MRTCQKCDYLNLYAGELTSNSLVTCSHPFGPGHFELTAKPYCHPNCPIETLKIITQADLVRLGLAITKDWDLIKLKPKAKPIRFIITDWLISVGIPVEKEK
jgi:hypothetical protein